VALFAHPESLVALAASGRPIPGGLGAGESQSGPTRGWSRSGSAKPLAGVSPAFADPNRLEPRTPPHGSCSTVARPGSGLVAQGGVVLAGIVADRGVLGRAFLDCADTVYTGRGAPIVASAVLDAKRPGEPPAAFPGMAPIAGQPGIFRLAAPLPASTSRAVARRVGAAWLVVRGSGSAAQHVAALRSLALGPLDLRPPKLSLHGPGNARCPIGARRFGGLIEVTQTQSPDPPARNGRNAAALQECSQANFDLGVWSLEATVFYAARTAPSPPKLSRLAGDPGTFHAGASLVAGPGVWRRIAGGWLLVAGGSGTAQQLALSKHLTARIALS
jgi:hypothetical protein